MGRSSFLRDRSKPSRVIRDLPRELREIRTRNHWVPNSRWGDREDRDSESKNLDPGCNMALNGTLRDGKTLEDGTITRTQSSENANKLENVVPEPGASVPTIISASNLGSFKVTGICTDSTRSGECELLGGFAAVKGMKFPKASLNVAEEDPKVVWEDV